VAGSQTMTHEWVAGGRASQRTSGPTMTASTLRRQALGHDMGRPPAGTGVHRHRHG
jgi:hypothetical protein